MSTQLTAKEMIAKAKEIAGTVPAAEFEALRNNGALIIDVREPGEWQEGHIENAVAVPRGTLEMKITELENDKQRSIVTYCASGGRAALAAATLRSMGYSAAVASDVGFSDLQTAGLPTSTPD